jgi:nitrite reductase (NO-forming)
LAAGVSVLPSTATVRLYPDRAHAVRNDVNPPADGRSREPRRAPGRRSPFAAVGPAGAIAVAYGIAALIWIAVGDRLPGGRWFAVHLFTLGVISNVVLVFSQHFGRTVTRASDEPWRWRTAGLNVGTVLVLIGIPAGMHWSTAIGTVIVTAVVFDGYLRLRRMRRQAVGARFSWIARVYERAHGSFIHGVTIGLLLGVGVLRGSWYGPGRLAHLHVNILGWAGLTLLATLVFFGPTVVRARIEEGADARAVTALRRGATGLTIAVLLLLASGIGGAAGTVLRLLSAVGLGVYAWATAVVCLPIIRVAWAAKPYAGRLPMIALCAWFVVVVWADVLVVATGQVRLLDALGLAALTGVLGQAIATTLAYVVPTLRGRSSLDRDRIMRRLSTGVVTRTATYNTGVAAVTAAAAGGPALGVTGSYLAALGWALVAAAVVLQIAAGLWPVRGPDGADLE